MSRSLGSRSFTTLPPMRPPPRVIASGPATIRSTLVFPQREGPRKTRNSPSPIWRSSLSTARVPSGYVFSSSNSSISATGQLQHHLAARTRGLGELGERELELVEREPVRDQRPGPEAARVQERDDAGPGRGSVAEAGREREVGVHDRIGREAELRAGGCKAEQKGRAAAPQGPHRRHDRL